MSIKAGFIHKSSMFADTIRLNPKAEKVKIFNAGDGPLYLLSGLWYTIAAKFKYVTDRSHSKHMKKEENYG